MNAPAATPEARPLYVLSPYHEQLAAQEREYRRIADDTAHAMRQRLGTLTPEQIAWAGESMRTNRQAADRIAAQIAWERWFDGSPQVWRPAEPSWSN